MIRIVPPDEGFGDDLTRKTLEKSYTSQHAIGDMFLLKEQGTGIQNFSTGFTTQYEPDPLQGRQSISETGSLPPREAPRRPRSATRMTVVALCILASAVSLEAVIVSTALPSIKRELHSGSANDYAWVGSAYLLTSTSVLPAWGRLSDIYGRKPVIIAADLLFVVGSVIAALANDMTVLLAGRATQGLGGGGLLVLINTCVADMFSLRERGQYIAIFGGVSAITASAAPVLGGWLAKDFTWRWCFWINLPLGLIPMVLMATFLNIETPRSSHGMRTIDWLGLSTISSGAVMLLVGMQLGGVNHPWSSSVVVGLLLGGCTTLGLFVLTQWKISVHPLIPPRILHPRSNISYLMIGFCHGFIYIGVVYYLPAYFQLVLNATPIQSGIWLLATALSMGIGAALSGTIVKRSGRHLEVIWISVALSALSFGLFVTLPPHREWSRIIIFQITMGLGLGPLFQAPLIGLLSTASQQDVASANSAFIFVRTLGSALSIVVGQVVIQNWLRMQSSDLIESGLNPLLVAKFTKDFTELSGQASSALPAHQAEAVRNALNSAMRSAWILYSGVAYAGCLFAATISRRDLPTESKPTQEEVEDH